MKKLLLVIAVIIVILLPVSAVLATPAYSFTINAYQHVIEQNDQLYIMTYSDNAVTDNLTFTMFVTSNATVLGTTTPYVYHTTGIAAIYFSANATPTWLGSYSVNMTGSAGGSATSSTIVWSSSTTLTQTSTDLTARVLYLAQTFSTNWGVALTQTDSNGVVTLNTAGQAYFVNTLPNLANVCPALFPLSYDKPIPQTKTQNTSAAAASDNRLIGTPFDFSGLATALGISLEWANALIWVLFWLAMTTLIAWRLKATRICLYIFGAAMIGGALLGFMGMLVGVLVGLLGGISLVYAFMWRQAS